MAMAVAVVVVYVYGRAMAVWADQSRQSSIAVVGCTISVLTSEPIHVFDRFFLPFGLPVLFAVPVSSNDRNFCWKP